MENFNEKWNVSVALEQDEKEYNKEEIQAISSFLISSVFEVFEEHDIIKDETIKDVFLIINSNNKDNTNTIRFFINFNSNNDCNGEMEFQYFGSNPLFLNLNELKLLITPTKD